MHWASQKQKGFTIVELLIVVVVIAVLAAITIVSYNGITNQAKRSAVASMASQVHKKLTLYAATNGEVYPATLAEAGIEPNVAANVQYSFNNASVPAGYCVTATQNDTSSYVAKTYTYTTSGVQTTNQSTPASGSCPGHAVNGATPAHNLALNPALRSNGTGWAHVSSSGGLPSGARTTAISGLSALGITTAYRITLGGTASSWWRVQYDSDTVVTEGQTYTLSAYIRPNVTVSTGVIIIWENASGGTVSESPGAFGSQAASSWARKSVTATAPAGAVSARFHFGATGGGANTNYLDATAAMFHTGSTLSGYADGASTDWVWEGAANASTSKGPAV